MPNQALLEFRSISKRFPGVQALDKVSFEVRAGEVLALMGENGAGKSTLMKIVGGIHQADAGTLVMDGRGVRPSSSAESIGLGIGFIHQELNVLDNLDVAGNVFLGREPLRGGPLRLLDRRAMDSRCAALLKELGLDLSPRTPLAGLSLAQRQMVEIVKALSLDAKLLIMDEPTSCLTLTETEKLLGILGDLKARGIAVIYISHRLHEVERCADRAVVLRDGKNAGELGPGAITRANLVRMMVGRELKDLYEPGSTVPGRGFFRIEGLRTRAYPGKSVDLDLAQGEILGMAGLVGSGRSEIAQAVFGVDARLAGRFTLAGREVRVRSPGDAIRAGICLVPEDRRDCGLVLRMSIKENITLPAARRHASLGFLSEASERAAADGQMRALGVRAASMDMEAGNLSGGNQQKVVLGKWLALKPRVLIVDEPTRGIDVGAKAEIYHLLRTLADSGCAVLVISSDMEEVLGICDRVAVIHEGALAGTLERAHFSEEAVMRLAVGEEAA